MNSILEKAYQNHSGRVKAELGQISFFRWNYYIAMLLGLMTLSALATRLSTNRDRETHAIHSAPNPAVQYLGQLQDLISKIRH